ncbi:broad specificity phosphatase PhoE [Ancylobacter sp. 3268]|uniref:histidine phosphatase family protein n=1 Tax=Ancylobacter sp. 3268 TaxID=2817752 RepID=UPI002857459F|nr:histidine phosphatase family protein [Ancylobacter sp. 3268]MDR6955799.1 broad specificity phosphatase PhoE [Ancylobacter sp. 3268]
MTTFLLLRHAAHENAGGFLAGRADGVCLQEAGLAQARRLGERLRREPIATLYSSPRERARQTAAAVAEVCGMAGPHVVEALDEIDFGAWSGSTFDVLNQDPAWRAWNERRSLARTPNGERMIDAQARMLAAMEQMALRAPDATVAFVTHADVIKAAVMYHLGLRLDDWWRLEIGPASITRVVVDNRGARLIGLNELVD